MHCCTETGEITEDSLATGYYISFSGIVPLFLG